MVAAIVEKEPEYVLNHCAKYLARDSHDERHSFFGLDAGQERARISEPWRFPVIDADDSGAPDASEWNHVTFIYLAPGNQPNISIALLTPSLGLACSRRHL